MFCMIGLIHHLQIIVFGEGSLVIMSPSLLLRCEYSFLELSFSSLIY